MNPTNASSFRRTACGLLLLIGPAMILVASILDPAAGEGGETADYLRAIVDDPDMAQVSTALWMFGFALTAIGIIGVVHVIRRRGVVLANLGGALALIGMIMFIALFSTTLHDLNNGEHLGLETAERLSDDLEDDYWLPYVVLVPALLGTLIGFILLGAAIIRSKVFHAAAGALIIVGILLVPASEESKAVNVLANVALLAGWGLAGLKLLGMKDAEWEGRLPDAGPPTAAVPPPAP